MALITIKDLNISKELDRKAMRALRGGYSWGYESGYTYEFIHGPHGFRESYNEYAYGWEFGHHHHHHGHRGGRRRRRRARRRAA